MNSLHRLAYDAERMSDAALDQAWVIMFAYEVCFSSESKSMRVC